MSSLLQPVTYHHNIRKRINYSIACVHEWKHVFAQKYIPDISNKSNHIITDQIINLYLKCFLVNEYNPVCSILWKAVTSPETLLNGYSVKIMLYKTPSPNFIVLASSSRLLSFTEYIIPMVYTRSAAFDCVPVSKFLIIEIYPTPCSRRPTVHLQWLYVHNHKKFLLIFTSYFHLSFLLL